MSTSEQTVNPILIREIDDLLTEWDERRIDRNDVVLNLLNIIKSVDANARGYAKLQGEETALDAVVNGGLDHGSAANWLAVVREKLEAGR